MIEKLNVNLISIMNTLNHEAKAVGKYLRLSPNKVNRILTQIRGQKYVDAMLILQFMPYKPCYLISKILNSAACNAEHNLKLKKEDLKIQSAFVDKGPIIKRFQPRAQGRAFPIQKPTCHITISVINQD